jgi:hypothetical protein
MINLASALRRGLLTLSLAAAMLAVVIGVTLATGVQSREAPSPAAPTAGDVWFPEPGTPMTYFTDSNLQAVVTLTKVSTATFDASTAKFNIVESDGHLTQYPAIAQVGADPNTVVITASGFSVTSAGNRIQFLISYSDASGTYSTAAYPVLVLTKRLYMPLVNYTADGSTPCSAFSANAWTPYSTTQYQAYRFYSITVPVTSTVYVTATKYSISNGQMQVRTRPDNSCVTTGTQYVLNYMTLLVTRTNNSFATYNMVPGNYLVRFSASTYSTKPFTFTWGYQAGRGPFEVNNTLCTAAAITPGSTNYAYPDDSDDFYYFDSPLSNATIKVTVSGYNLPGQYQLIKGNPDCNTYVWPPVAVKDAQVGTVTMSATGQSAGRYFLRILATGQTGYNQSGVYSFKVDISTSSALNSPSTEEVTPTPIGLPSEEGTSEVVPGYSSQSSQAPAP